MVGHRESCLWSTDGHAVEENKQKNTSTGGIWGRSQPLLHATDEFRMTAKHSIKDVLREQASKIHHDRAQSNYVQASATARCLPFFWITQQTSYGTNTVPRKLVSVPICRGHILLCSSMHEVFRYYTSSTLLDIPLDFNSRHPKVLSLRKYAGAERF